MNKRFSQYKDGVRKEAEFGSLFPKFELSNQADDLNHIDIRISFSADVKSGKKVRRSDDKINYKYHWVEITNVAGMPGWLYGQCDYIAFEQEDEWLLVEPKRLQKLVNTKLLMKKGNGPWESYSRKNRDDLITLVPIQDIVEITNIIVKK